MARSETDLPHHDNRNARRRANIALIGFLLVAGFYLITEHRAHLFGILPFVLLLSCPLTHLFMHHGHGGGHSSDAGADAGSSSQSLGRTRP